VPLLAKQFADVFPELKAQQDFVINVIREEESSFLRTLSNGIKRFAVIEDDLAKQNTTNISGKIAFELFDTYGFPLDLTRLMASEKNYSVDEVGFIAEMTQQKDRARNAAATEQSDWTILGEDSKSEFVGYDETESSAHVIKYRKVVQKDKTLYQLVLDKTPFYAESGGQIGDTGTLDFGGELIDVLDTKKENDLIVHFTKKLPAKIDASVNALINISKRSETIKNHSATHLLQAALRQVLGEHVQQKGSLVNTEYLRFDFSHFAKVSDEDIAKIEQIVNEKIMQNIPLDERRSVPIEEAKKMGATALFGEKYGEFVRVITFDKDFSRELCGGTHVQATGQIGLFKITSESSVAAGVRRIEAVTGTKALNLVNDAIAQLSVVKAALNNSKDLLKSINTLREQNEGFKKQLSQFEDKAIAALKSSILKEVESLGTTKFYASDKVDIQSVDALRKLGIQLVGDLKDSYVLVLSANINDKQVVHLRIAPSFGVNGNQLLKELAPDIKGGGPADFVQASAANATEIKTLIEKVKARFN
jgi:alanyl-tRNA synthetase